ncbi:MAG: hypothetical protein EOM12_10525 [Verrucomicrobiae bacterium]|nr:hypothetical protein [Verrucomicrobiae bacterium]
MGKLEIVAIDLLKRNGKKDGGYGTPIEIRIDGEPLDFKPEKNSKWNSLVEGFYKFCTEKKGCSIEAATESKYRTYIGSPNEENPGRAGSAAAVKVLEYLAQQCFPHAKGAEVLTEVYQNHKNETLNHAEANAEVNKGGGGKEMSALNTILYGPPGTGKTYSVLRRAVEIVDGVASDEDDRVTKRRYNELVEKGQIVLVTFHQSYSYEDFVEGIRPVISDEESQGAKYECRSGVFREICSMATTYKQRVTRYDFDPEEINLSEMSLGNACDGEESVYDYCAENNVISLGWGGNTDYSGCTSEDEIRKKCIEADATQSRFSVEAIKRFIARVNVGDIVVISNGKFQARAIARVTGEYYYNPETSIRHNHFREVEWLYKDVAISVRQILRKGRRFSSQSIYQEDWHNVNIAGLNALVSAEYNNKKQPNCVMIIDEINRGNISKIFGELITLIEPDKREGASNELRAILPYSQCEFSVPSNFYILATMNTADKSIALVDIALRRRFVFEELMPDFTICKSLDEEMRAVLSELNHRILLRKDRDHQVGHSYFMDVDDKVSFNRVFKRNVLPLLQEYFWNDWEGLRFVLGEEGNRSRFVVAIADNAKRSSRNAWQWYSDAREKDFDYLGQLNSNYNAKSDTDA